MKIIFYYENGTTYTVNNVRGYKDYGDVVVYSITKELVKGIYQDIETFIHKDILVAYEVREGSKITVHKLKPCANVVVDVFTSK